MSHTITTLLPILRTSYTDITFRSADHFGWLPVTRTVTYLPTGDVTLLLHELGHALLGHTSYKRDIELIVMEREAWEQARSIGNRFGHPVTDEIIEDALDTYRDWLHRRSLCPNCAMTGIQTDNYTYHCPTCTQSWRVNEARTCQLKRYRTKNDPIK